MHPDDQLTITFWVRVDRINGYSPILHKGGALRGQFANREYALYVKDTTPESFHFQFFSAGGGQGQHEVLSTGSYRLHQWLFVAAIVDRKNHVMRTSVNDSLEADAEDSYSSFNVNDFPLTIGVEDEGATGTLSPFKGALDEMRFYRRALTRNEIRDVRDSR